jgi:hypothetical protein
MIIKLIKKIPQQDGLYLVKFSADSTLHLVEIRTESNKKRIIVPDICPFRGLKGKYDTLCINNASKLYFSEFPDIAYWSNEPIEIELDI